MTAVTEWVVKEVLADEVEMRETNGGYWKVEVHARARAVLIQMSDRGPCHEMRIVASASAGFDDDSSADLAVKDAVAAALARVRGMAAGFIAAYTAPVEHPAEPLRVHTIIVNGQAIEVPRRDGDNVYGVAERAVALGSYGIIQARPWEIKDEMGSVLGVGDDPDRIRHVSLRAGTAS